MVRVSNRLLGRLRRGEYGLLKRPSYHSGGVNAALADGSVKFLKSSINMTVYWSLGTKDAGEVISAHSY